MKTLRECANPLVYLKQFGFTKPLEILGLEKKDGNVVKMNPHKKAKVKQAKASRKKNRR